MSLYHVFTAYASSDPDTVRRNRLAQTTWARQPWHEAPVYDNQLPRMWREEGREFPYIRDVMDEGLRGASDHDIGIYTNADILVTSHCGLVVAGALQDADACYAYRRDFGRLDAALPDDQVPNGAAYAGSDLCGFRVGWWRKWRTEMPDMVLGLEAWDPCYRTLVDATNPGRRVVVENVIYHERHGSYWERSENRYRLKGQKYCLKLAADFLRRHGKDPARHGIR